jgi:hypothetical protein
MHIKFLVVLLFQGIPQEDQFLEYVYGTTPLGYINHVKTDFLVEEISILVERNGSRSVSKTSVGRKFPRLRHHPLNWRHISNSAGEMRREATRARNFVLLAYTRSKLTFDTYRLRINFLFHSFWFSFRTELLLLWPALRVRRPEQSLSIVLKNIA